MLGAFHASIGQIDILGIARLLGVTHQQDAARAAIGMIDSGEIGSGDRRRPIGKASVRDRRQARHAERQRTEVEIVYVVAIADADARSGSLARM